MKSTIAQVSTFAAFLIAGAGIHTASAGLNTLFSPDNKWSLTSDEFGAYGEAVAGSFAQRDFGLGLTGYSWASSMLLSEGASRQWLTGIDLGLNSQTLLTAGNLISDLTVGNVRTSAFTVPGFASIRLDLIQTVSNSGIFQEYRLTNNRATAASLSLMSFHDVDLDAATAGNDLASAVGGTLKVSEGGREIFFNPSLNGYVGYLVGHVPTFGVTYNLDKLGYDNFGIPAANLNQFRDVTGVGDGMPVGADFDVNGDKISDTVSDLGYLFQNSVTIPAGGSVSLSFGALSTVPEPSSALLCLLGLGLVARRRR